jgi:hypothetical protein
VVGDVNIEAGTPNVYSQVGGVLHTQSAQAGNIASASTTVLFEYYVPGGVLAVDGQSVWFEFTGTLANNAASRSLVFNWNGYAWTLFSALVTNAFRLWSFKGRITRRDVNTQKIAFFIASQVGNGVPNGNAITSTALSGPNVLRMSGQSLTANSVTLESAIIGWDSAGP